MWRELYKLHNIWLIYVNYDISISTSILLSVTSKPTWDILYVKFSQQYIMHVNDSSNVRTYVLVLAQDICVMRVSYQLSSELSFAGVYPGTGGVSGNRSRNLPNLRFLFPGCHRPILRCWVFLHTSFINFYYQVFDRKC